MCVHTDNLAAPSQSAWKPPVQAASSLGVGVDPWAHPGILFISLRWWNVLIILSQQLFRSSFKVNISSWPGPWLVESGQYGWWVPLGCFCFHTAGGLSSGTENSQEGMVGVFVGTGCLPSGPKEVWNRGRFPVAPLGVSSALPVSSRCFLYWMLLTRASVQSTEPLGCSLNMSEDIFPPRRPRFNYSLCEVPFPRYMLVPLVLPFGPVSGKLPSHQQWFVFHHL